MVVCKISVKLILVKSCLLILHYQLGIAQVITLYSEGGHTGTAQKVDISKCYSLPTTFLDRASSINSNGTCARLFDGLDCIGNSVEIFARSPYHYSLVPWRFNDRTKSAGPCRDSCDAEITGAPLQDGESLDLEIFSDPNHEGEKANLKVEGCTIIPIAFPNVMSVYTFGRCFHLYNNVECLHQGEKVERIELRPGTPTVFYNNLGKWGLTKFKSVSPCSYKCPKNLTNVATTSSYITSQNESDVIPFDSRNFRSNLKRFLVGECANVNVGEEWEDIAVSIRTFFDTCVSLYDQTDCQGKSLNITASNGDPSNFHFSQVAMSLRLCSNSSQKRDSILATNGNHFNNDSNNLPSPNDTKINSSPEGESATNSNQCSVSTIIIVLGTAILLVVVIEFIVLFVILRKKYSWRMMLQAKISRKEIQEFLLGSGGHFDSDYELNSHNDINLDGGVAAQYKSYNEDSSVTNSIWQISNRHLMPEILVLLTKAIYFTDAAGCDK